MHSKFGRSFVCSRSKTLCLGQARLLSWDVAPFLDHGLLHLPRVGPGPGAHLLGHVHTLLGGLELGHQLGHVLAGPLRLKGTLLLGGILDNSLHFLETLLRALLEAAASRGTEFSGLLGAGSDGGVFLNFLLGDIAYFLRPLRAFCVGSIA